MDFSSFNPYAPTPDVIGDAVSPRASIQAMPGIAGAIDHDHLQDRRQNTMRGRQILIVMLDDEEITFPSSDIKCVWEIPDTVLWTNPTLSTSGARQMAAHKDTRTPMASDPHHEQNVANARTNVERNAFVSAPDLAIDNPDAEIPGGHVKNEWPSQEIYQRSVHSNLHGNSGLPQYLKATISGSLVIPPVDESSSRNRVRPNNTVTPFPSDPCLNVERHYNQYSNDPFSHANTPRIPHVPTTHLNQALDNALGYANTISPSTMYSPGGPHGPESASVRPYTVAQAPHPGGNADQANPGLQQGGSPKCHEMDHREPSHDTLSRPEAQMPEIAIGSGAAGPYREPEMPEKQQMTVGSPCGHCQIHSDTVQLEWSSMGRPSRRLKTPQSAAHKAMTHGKPKGRRTKPLTSEQKIRANIVRSAGPKNCNCSQRKVRCPHVVAEIPQSPAAHGSGPFLAATNAQTETAIHGEPDTPSSQNTSWLTETTALSPFSPSRNQSFGNTADLDMSRMNLLTEDYQPVIEVDDAEGDTDDEEMLEMGITPSRSY